MDHSDNEPSNNGWALYIGIVTGLMCIMGIPNALIYRYRHLPGIRHRGALLSLISGFSLYTIICLSILRLVVTTPINCMVDIWILAVSTSLHCASIVARAVRVIFLYRVSEARYRMTRNLSETSGLSIESDSDTEGAHIKSERQRKMSLKTGHITSPGYNQQRRRQHKAWRSREHLQRHSGRLTLLLKSFTVRLKPTPSTRLLRKKTKSSSNSERLDPNETFTSQIDLVEMDGCRSTNRPTSSNTLSTNSQTDESQPSSPTVCQTQANEIRKSKNDDELAATDNTLASKALRRTKTNESAQWSPESPLSKNIQFDFLAVKPEKQFSTWIYRHRHWARTQFILRVLAIILMANLAVTALIQLFLTPLPDIIPSTAVYCYNSAAYLIMYAIPAAFVGVLIWMVIFPLSSVNDAFYIRNELVMVSVITALVALASVTIFIYNMFENKNIDKQSYGFSACMMIASFMGYIATNIFPLIDSIRLDRLAKAATGFTESLANPSSFEKFKVFSIIDFSVENVLFYDKVRRVRALQEKKQGGTSSGNGSRRNRSNIIDANAASMALNKRIEREIRSIYNKFIIPGAEYELNLESDTRKDIIKDMQHGSPHVSIYDTAFSEISTLMLNNTYPRFLQWNAGQDSSDDINRPGYPVRSADEHFASFSDVPHSIVVDSTSRTGDTDTEKSYK
ncbi:hypothetical protein BDF19DRAFT_449809 [Syncephalis fuscata]|nr:hypothetical protein BDF19DRAFT_449809 [Syncephalis fuscata]